MSTAPPLFNVYRHLAIGRARPPPTAAEIDAIEECLGTTLPASFRDYLDRANGGYLDYVVDVPVGDEQTEELCFCGLFATGGPAGHETFLHELRTEREYRGVPPGVLPFARDGGGSVVYLDLSPAGAGRVVAFVHGLPAWTGLTQDSMFVEVASSFDNYVSKLRVDREGALDTLQNDSRELSHVEAMEQFLDIGLPGWRESDDQLQEAVRRARERLIE